MCSKPYGRMKHSCDHFEAVPARPATVSLAGQRKKRIIFNYMVETKTNLIDGSWSLGPSMSVETNATGAVINNVTNSIPTDEANKFIRLEIELQ